MRPKLASKKLGPRGIWLLVTLALVSVSCKASRSSLSQTDPFYDRYQDVFVLSETLVKSPLPCRVNLLNFASTSLADGLLLNGALTGLGTSPPVGKALTTDSAYFQALRVYSIADWEMAQRLRQDRAGGCLPAEVHMGYGSLPRDSISRLPRPYPDQVDKMQKALRAISKDIPSFDVVSAGAFAAPRPWPRSPGGSPSHQGALREGYLARLKHIESHAKAAPSVITKLKAMAMAYGPVGLTIDAAFPQGGAGSLFLEAYLPPIYELDTAKSEDPNQWRLTRGLARRPLPQEVDISIARLTHIAYLSQLDDQAMPLIKVQLYKDFARPDIVQTRVIFGKSTGQDGEGGVIPVDWSDPKSALYISFFPNFVEQPSDSSIIKSLKKELNKILSPLRIDARIHQLALELRRDSESDPVKKGPDSVMLRPHFSLANSDISFRLYVNAEEESSVKALSLVGFVCSQETGTAKSKICTRDFGAYAELSNFFSDHPEGLGKSIKTSLASAFQSVLSLLAKYNAKFLINLNMREIEAAVDQQFMAIFENVASNQVDARLAIQKKIESQLFKN